MNEVHRKVTDELAEKIKNELRGGKLLGEPIDLNDLNQMIVATKFFYELKSEKERWGWRWE